MQRTFLKCFAHKVVFKERGIPKILRIPTQSGSQGWAQILEMPNSLGIIFSKDWWSRCEGINGQD
jgi:hypothetical protein